MVSRQYAKYREERFRNAMRRYDKDRQRNVMAKPGIHEFIMVLDHLGTGFNAPKIFRSAEVFGAHEVQLVNVGKFDPAPAKGAFRKVPAKFFEDIGDCFSNLKQRGYTLFSLEADKGTPLYETELPAKSAFILGHEERGISFDYADYPDVKCLSIPHVGETESLNVSIAGSIVMYEYLRQHQAR